MLNTPIQTQRLNALRIAVERKQQFDSLAEMRKIKHMTVLSWLIEFECATAKTLLDLLEQRNNAILTQMVNQRLIKIHRWQNSQVYVPTEAGKKWLLQQLDDSGEIERVRSTPIKRKIGGYSAEHDLLVQRAAINCARDNQKPGEEWRIFKPRRTKQTGKVPDAKIVYTRDSKTSRAINVEVERTQKHPVELICSVLRNARNLWANESTAILCTKQRIALDYIAALFALRDVGMQAPVCGTVEGAVQRYALATGENLFPGGQLDRISVDMIDEDGQATGDDLAAVDVLFTQVYWMLALRQYEQDWQTWARRAAYQIVRSEQLPWPKYTLDENGIEEDDNGEPDVQVFDQPAEVLGSELIDVLGHGGDNPMRSAADLLRARDRWNARLRAKKGTFFL